jgi:hypothetical protein
LDRHQQRLLLGQDFHNSRILRRKALAVVADLVVLLRHPLEALVVLLLVAMVVHLHHHHLVGLVHHHQPMVVAFKWEPLPASRDLDDGL